MSDKDKPGSLRPAQSGEKRTRPDTGASRSNSPLCEPCRLFMVDLIDSRIRKILKIGQEDEEDDGQAHCFHLMEIQRIVEGKTTCGVFDGYGFAEAPAADPPASPESSQDGAPNPKGQNAKS